MEHTVRTGNTLAISFLTLALLGCSGRAEEPILSDAGPVSKMEETPIESPVIRKLVEGGIEQTEYTVYYDPAYVGLEYPGGDVPRERGVCSDVVVRALRKCDIDLQKEVHEDMRGNFSVYPNKWGLTKPDRNIDHRRVPNLMKFFERRGKSLPITDDPADYKPGDIIAWRLENGLLHVGLVTNTRPEGSSRYHIVHNIGAGAKVEDRLFAWTIIGHYRYFRF